MTIISRPFYAADGILLDTNWKPTLAQAKAWWDAGVRGVFRYFFFGPARPGDLDAAELQMLLALGFWVGAVQHVPLPGWWADLGTGLGHAQSVVANAIRAGYVTPDGQHPVTIAIDMEGVKNPGAGCVDYCRVGMQVRASHGYANLGYCGYDSGLGSADLELLTADETCGCPDPPEWWCDYASLAQRPVPPRGYALHQKPQSTIAGVGVDVDQVLRDGVIWGLVSRDLNQEPSDPAAGQGLLPAA